ncbi:MAG: LytTR family DNA-binding domain-containing protein [Flavobacteriales bacterium]|nr:LytTR family DNA-binding domain-containing protein [Flavobacteriales bacterium]
MKVLIADDEKRTVEGMASLLRNSCPEIDELLTAGSLAAATKVVIEQSPDLVLLDIHLGDGSGFDLIPELRKKQIPVVFITAHEEFALRAFQVAALHYLLKPVDPHELTLAVQRAFIEFQKKELDTRLQLLLQQFASKQNDTGKIVLKTSESIHIIDIKDIEYCEADKNYTTFVMHDNTKIVVSKSIGEYEDLLGKQGFLRIHQSFLLNTIHISRLDRADGGMIVTTNGNQLPIASRKKDVVMAYLNRLG